MEKSASIMIRSVVKVSQLGEHQHLNNIEVLSYDHVTDLHLFKSSVISLSNICSFHFIGLPRFSFESLTALF